MKKKGLIIATIVMVLVLAVSLTTATYAWFTVSDVTTIEAFNVEVVPNNAVRIGVKANNTYEAAGATNPALYYNGDVVYGNQTAGAIGGGQWTGSQDGLGASINHNIAWGSQKKAVGITSAAVAEATYGNTTAWTATTGTVVAANGKENQQSTAKLDNPVAARANLGETEGAAGDYAYLFLGVQAVKELTTNQLIILVDNEGSKSQYVGIMSAVHVAYRINGGEWKDEDVFGADKADTTDTIEGNHYNTLVSAVTTNLTAEQQASYTKSYDNKAFPANGAMGAVIDLSTLANSPTGDIVQIELVIYLAGADTDCITGALGSSGNISIFFHTV